MSLFDGWTRMHWTTYTVEVDGEEYDVTTMAPWYVPLWLVRLLRRRRLLREIRDGRFPRARTVRS